MLKSIAMTHSECTTKQENKASYNTDYIVPDWIEFFDGRLKKETYIIVNKIVLTKNWFAVSNF